MRSIFAYLALLAGLLPAAANTELLGAPLVLIAVLAGWGDLRRVSRVLLLLVAGSGLAAWHWAPDLLLRAAVNTTHLTALVVAVMLLSATLGTSRDLGVLSSSLFGGRPLPRYLGISFATGFLAVPLNFGSVGVMSTVVARVKHLRGDSSLTRNAARAVLRGFALASICSPLSVSVVITLTFLPTLGLHQLIAVSLPFAGLYLLLGSVFREPEEVPAMDAPALPGAEADVSTVLPWLRFTAYIISICLGAWALSSFGQMRYSLAVALSCLGAVVFGWLLKRLRGEPDGLPSMAQVGNELVVMCGSAFLGVLASGAGLYLLGLDVGLPVWASPWVAFVVPFVLFLAGMSGLNPIVTGTLVGAMLAPVWPPSAFLGLGIGMVSGWGLTVAGTPYSANSMLLSRITGYDAQTAALQWNLRLSIWALCLAGLLAAGLTHWLVTAP
ncbi:hypothetical protein LPB72_01260 [Hydrogenophaga crassostreae]|uniref:C4-dicarboxylate ABC transporter n=1 Tax=Hydrogenophaga crassostreae TaxID=1763535 RepID=A0A163CR54_9BURK|nr:hypothetical protein LPB072_14555 [Hydrogenophaga crassostreae]OAD44341.1 hypothetical protein LPB72_01260 [Hydrogenophaga crassostreae]